jgi:hypothetical protein
MGPVAREEWQKQVAGLKNNQPAVIGEWLDIGPAGLKRRFRERFGDLGDRLRRDGWGAVKLGPLTKAAITRFMAKLGQALYYRHLDEIFYGHIYALHLSGLEDRTQNALQEFLRIVPALEKTERNNQDLSEQFSYRYNWEPELGVLAAMARFNEQMIFNILCLTDRAIVALNDEKAARAKILLEVPHVVVSRPANAHM